MTQIIAPAKKVDGNCYACMFVVKAMYETQRDGKLKQVPFKIDNWKNSTDRSWYIRLDKEPEGLVSVCYDDSMRSYPTRLIFATSNSAGIFTAPGEYVNIFHKMLDSDVAIAVEPKLRLSATEFQLPSWVWGNAYIEPKNVFTAKRANTTLADAEQVNPGIWTAPKGVTRPILRVFNRMHRSNDLQEVPFIKTGTIEGRNVFFVPSHIECGQLVVEYDTTFATGSTNTNSDKPAQPPQSSNAACIIVLVAKAKKTPHGLRNVFECPGPIKKIFVQTGDVLTQVKDYSTITTSYNFTNPPSTRCINIIFANSPYIDHVTIFAEIGVNHLTQPQPLTKLVKVLCSNGEFRVTQPVLRAFMRCRVTNNLDQVPYTLSNTNPNILTLRGDLRASELYVEYLATPVPACPPAPEPTFTLRAQDATAPAAIELWIAMNSVSLGTSHPKIRSARAVINAMLAWPKHKLPD